MKTITYTTGLNILQMLVPTLRHINQNYIVYLSPYVKMYGVINMAKDLGNTETYDLLIVTQLVPATENPHTMQQGVINEARILKSANLYETHGNYQDLFTKHSPWLQHIHNQILSVYHDNKFKPVMFPTLPPIFREYVYTKAS